MVHLSQSRAGYTGFNNGSGADCEASQGNTFSQIVPSNTVIDINDNF